MLRKASFLWFLNLCMAFVSFSPFFIFCVLLTEERKNFKHNLNLQVYNLQYSFEQFQQFLLFIPFILLLVLRVN